MSNDIKIYLEVDDVSAATSAIGAKILADQMRLVEGVKVVDLRRASSDSMDLGSIVEIVLTSGASLALAHGLANWLKARRGAKVTISTDSPHLSVKTIVEGIDPQTAERIVARHF